MVENDYHLLVVLASRFHDALRLAGLRVTRQRLAVLAALSVRPDAVTAQDLYEGIRKRRGAPGLATVYRTLTALAEAGVIDTFNREGELAYRLCGESHHHHLVCESCGAVQEVEARQVESWIRSVARRRGFVVTGHTADVYGLCRDCR
jgi:Fur family ferric uptake transcriptional regulator